MKSELFTVIGGSLEPEVYLKCNYCDELFWVDPCGEENLTYNSLRKCLVPECPCCGAVDYDWGISET